MKVNVLVNANEYLNQFAKNHFNVYRVNTRFTFAMAYYRMSSQNSHAAAVMPLTLATFLVENYLLVSTYSNFY